MSANVGARRALPLLRYEDLLVASAETAESGLNLPNCHKLGAGAFISIGRKIDMK
jgi:hypothetical protein